MRALELELAPSIAQKVGGPSRAAMAAAQQQLEQLVAARVAIAWRMARAIEPLGEALHSRFGAFSRGTRAGCGARLAEPARKSARQQHAKPFTFATGLFGPRRRN